MLEESILRELHIASLTHLHSTEHALHERVSELLNTYAFFLEFGGICDMHH